MSVQKPPSKSFNQVRAEQLEYNAKREAGYRERALKLYPWICGRCTREFDRKNLSELTVHHVDHCASSDHMGPISPFSKRHFSADCFSSLAC
jgi:hypothetical protein